jgi:hypothetical protein
LSSLQPVVTVNGVPHDANWGVPLTVEVPDDPVEILVEHELLGGGFPWCQRGAGRGSAGETLEYRAPWWPMTRRKMKHRDPREAGAKSSAE